MFDFAISLVLSFCEREYLYVSVNRSWRQKYLRMFKPITSLEPVSLQQIEWIISWSTRSTSLLGWMNGKRYTFSNFSYNYIVYPTNLEVMKSLYQRGFVPDARTVERAAKEGYLDILKWVIHINRKWLTERVINIAIARGHMNVLIWFEECNECLISIPSLFGSYRDAIIWRPEHYIIAIRSGNLEVVQWLYKQCCPWNHTVLLESINKRQHHITEWLYIIGAPTIDYQLHQNETNLLNRLHEDVRIRLHQIE